MEKCKNDKCPSYNTWADYNCECYESKYHTCYNNGNECDHIYGNCRITGKLCDISTMSTCEVYINGDGDVCRNIIEKANFCSRCGVEL